MITPTYASVSGATNTSGSTNASASGATNATSNSSNSTTPKLQQSQPNDRLGKDAFFKLLVAQLKYQDPLKPMEGAEFISQTAQLTMTETLDELSKSQQTSIADGNRRTAADLVGRIIAYSNGNAIVEGKVTGALMNGGNPVLLVGKTEVPLAGVIEIRTAKAPATTPA